MKVLTNECNHYEHYVTCEDRYICPRVPHCPECGLPVEKEGELCGECMEKIA